eukprot:CAMPEP_0175081924 /NCGR_PEP_ID=MMETSP0052_2-20121109/26447_1 /TAXON_ID=51329 ORGANISM="Polytomella parva, Strain SAG 63-3" /NCGR_SAMPLE_ID=MMETSP0052_2 /ASSEMBLY_ACC=CAM_ASM_000194 /LENGTH=517 /DNA_ID=CAMNT_0016353017 /DNA_START=185 /DNA_END=1738 /DNA_ORIENTATION=-
MSDSCIPTVTYGLANNPNISMAVNGSTYTITEAQMCDAPANSRPFKVIMHKAVLTTTVDDTLHFYRVGNGSTNYFTSPKLPSTSKSINFIAYADMGEGVVRLEDREALGTSHLVQSIHRGTPLDFIAHVGDLAYADGKYTVWDSFMRLIEPTASRIPYMIAIGNHEFDYLAGGEKDRSNDTHYEPSWGNFDQGDSGGECGAMTTGRFPMPRPQPEVDNPPYWYSFEVGPVHFVVISTEHRVSPGSPQYTWISNHLAAVDRCRTPWLVALYHRPMYVVYPHKDNRVVGQHLKSFLEDLLALHEVDFTISGHVHSYYRTCAVYKNKCTDLKGGAHADEVLEKDTSEGVGKVTAGEDARQAQLQVPEEKAKKGTSSTVKGVTHFVLGTGGHILSTIEGKQELWVERGLMMWGVGTFNITGDTMRFKFMADANGTAVDEAVVYNKAAGRVCPSPTPVSPAAAAAPPPPPLAPEEAVPEAKRTGEVSWKGKQGIVLGTSTEKRTSKERKGDAPYRRLARDVL